MNHPADDLQAQRIAAQALVGKLVIWAHWETGSLKDSPAKRFKPNAPIRVAAAHDGMVTLKGWAGEFAPHLFIVVEEEHRP